MCGWDGKECTNTNDEARRSFPSGHSSTPGPKGYPSQGRSQATLQATPWKLPVDWPSVNCQSSHKKYSTRWRSRTSSSKEWGVLWEMCHFALQQSQMWLPLYCLPASVLTHCLDIPVCFRECFHSRRWMSPRKPERFLQENPRQVLLHSAGCVKHEQLDLMLRMFTWNFCSPLQRFL